MPTALPSSSALFCAVLFCMATDARSQTVPDLFEMTVAQAEDRLSRLGLTPVVEYEDSNRRRDTILRQIPGRGGSAGEGNLVMVWVSNGLVLPDGIVGQSPETARAILEGMDATVQVTTRDVVSSADNRVLEVAGWRPGDRFDATTDALTLVISNEVGVEVPRLDGATPEQMEDLLHPLDLTLNYVADLGSPDVPLGRCWIWVLLDSGRSVSPDEGQIVQRGTMIKVRDYEIWSQERIWGQLSPPDHDHRCHTMIEDP